MASGPSVPTTLPFRPINNIRITLSRTLTYFYVTPFFFRGWKSWNPPQLPVPLACVWDPLRWVRECWLFCTSLQQAAPNPVIETKVLSSPDAHLEQSVVFIAPVLVPPVVFTGSEYAHLLSKYFGQLLLPRRPHGRAWGDGRVSKVSEIHTALSYLKISAIHTALSFIFILKKEKEVMQSYWLYRIFPF